MSLLKGNPQELAFNKYNEDTNLYSWTTYGNFIIQLEKAFRDPNPASIAKRELRNLRQTNRPFSTYLIEFRRLIGRLNYDNTTQIAYLRNRLYIKIEELLITRNELPTNLNNFTALY